MGSSFHAKNAPKPSSRCVFFPAEKSHPLPQFAYRSKISTISSQDVIPQWVGEPTTFVRSPTAGKLGGPYSPVSDWIKQVDLVLEDKGQQYGNMEEAATIACTPRTCFEIWSGDHRQTPGGLQQTEEAKKFRHKLLKRPLALRCPTDYIQPHGLAAIAARYLEGHPDSPQVTLARFLREEAKTYPALVDQIWAELVGQGEVKVSTQVQKAAMVILWMAMPGNEIANTLSKTFAEAAGVEGRQKWGLALSSSTRVTQMIIKRS